MRQLLNTIFDYKGLGGQTAKCGLQAFGDGRRAVVVLTELHDNPGTSVTNFAVELANEVVLAHPEILRDEVLWLEHYPTESRSGRPETLDRILLTPEGQKFTRAEWRPFSREKLKQIIGFQFVASQV